MLFPDSGGDLLLCQGIRRVTNGYVVTVPDFASGPREIVATTLADALAVVAYRDGKYRVGERPTVTIGVETGAKKTPAIPMDGLCQCGAADMRVYGGRDGYLSFRPADAAEIAEHRVQHASWCRDIRSFDMGPER